jgi:hypothetical protein
MGVCEAGKSPHRHSHGQILPLDVAGGNVTRLRRSADFFVARPDDVRGAVARFTGALVSVNLHKQGIIHVTAKGVVNRVQIDAQAIGRQLNLAGESAGIRMLKFCRSTWLVSCREFADNQVRLQLFALAYNLGNFLRRLALPSSVKHWSLTTLREKLIKIGAKVVHHARSVVFQMAEVAIPRELFRLILARIRRLRLPMAASG